MNEDPLSRGARAMLQQALVEEQSLSPSASHRRRLKRSLLSGAALAGAGGAATAKAASALPLLGLGKSMALGLLISGGVLGAAQVIGAPEGATAPPSGSAVAAAPPRAVAPPPPPVAASASAAPEPVSAPRPTPRPAFVNAPAETPSSAPALRAELDLLSAAQTAQRDGRAAEALTLIRRYDATFPAGQLVSARLAVEVFAACALGDRAGAARAAERFLRRDSSSALAERVKRACPFDQKESPP